MNVGPTLRALATNVVGGLIAGGLSGTLVASCTKTYNTIVYPPHASLQGLLVSKNRSVGNLLVSLDGVASRPSSASGDFVFANVGLGDHFVDISSSSHQIVCQTCKEFVISADKADSTISLMVNLDVIPAAPVSNPVFKVSRTQASSPISLKYSDQSCPQSQVTHCISVRVAGSSVSVSQISQVTYYLPPAFRPSVVIRYHLKDLFC
jgi:hypothetical protein